MHGQPISCSLEWGGQHFAITGWARGGRWAVIAGVATVAPFVDDAAGKTGAVVHAVSAVAGFIADPGELEPGIPRCLTDFAAAIHAGGGKGGALDRVVAAMAGAELSIEAEDSQRARQGRHEGRPCAGT